MKALVIIAHGSRRAESNEEVANLAEQVRQRAEQHYAIVEHAFLELAEPALPDVIESLIEHGSDEIVILPYFLNSGNHVREDIPTLLSNARHDHPACEFKLAQPIGMYAGMPELILAGANQA